MRCSCLDWDRLSVLLCRRRWSSFLRGRLRVLGMGGRVLLPARLLIEMRAMSLCPSGCLKTAEFGLMLSSGPASSGRFSLCSTMYVKQSRPCLNHSNKESLDPHLVPSNQRRLGNQIRHHEPPHGPRLRHLLNARRRPDIQNRPPRPLRLPRCHTHIYRRRPPNNLQTHLRPPRVDRLPSDLWRRHRTRLPNHPNSRTDTSSPRHLHQYIDRPLSDESGWHSHVICCRERVYEPVGWEFGTVVEWC